MSGLLFSNGLQAQELGYVAGISKMGIEPASYQPVYGISLGFRFSKYLGLETLFFYSQRSRQHEVQSDYITMSAILKAGYFTKKAGGYFFCGPGLNPALYHRNTENHTYLSSWQGAGAEIRLSGKLCADLKLGYDVGLTGGYFKNGTYTKYKGPLFTAGLKYDISCR